MKLIPTNDRKISHAERIKILRERCLDRKNRIPNWITDPRLTARSLMNSEQVTSWQVRRGLLTRDRLSGTILEVDDLELLVGRLAPDSLGCQAEVKKAECYLEDHYPHINPPGQTGHCELDLSLLYKLGIDGLIKYIQQLLSSAGSKQVKIYQSFLYALEGLVSLINHATKIVEQTIPGASPPRQSELYEMAAICQWITREPPRTFRETLQLLWLTLLGTQRGDQIALVNPGRLDRTLWSYYEADLKSGRLTQDEALLLLECFYLLLNEYIPDGLAIAVMVGGRDVHGNDATNDLSYLCLEALRRTNLIYPTVGVCWHENTPIELVNFAVELISKGYKQPAFFGDETIQRGLRLYGVSPNEACNYINSTCVEITPCGSSNVWVATPYFSVCEVLLEEIEAQANTKHSAESYEDFINAYLNRLGCQIKEAVREVNSCRKLRQEFGGKPLQSIFTRNCLDRGQDIDDGGALYNWVECSFVGLANLIDSLYVIREQVYRQPILDMAKLNRILKNDFVNFAKERLQFLLGYPKYGNDYQDVDGLMGEITCFIKDECSRHQVYPDGSSFVPGAFCWIMHEQLGRECGATPDGRKAGFPFADGCGGAQGRELKGPTAAVLSVTSWDQAPFIGGAAFNMKFNRALFCTDDSVQRLRDLIITFLLRGGFETQINVLDVGVLREARLHPESYRDIIVRIGGYTDYFTRLSPEMQEELILRTEYDHF